MYFFLAPKCPLSRIQQKVMTALKPWHLGSSFYKFIDGTRFSVHNFLYHIDVLKWFILCNLSFSSNIQNLQEYELKLSVEKRKQASLIGQLKDQLEEMEKCVAMVRLTLVVILHVLNIEILEI